MNSAPILGPDLRRPADCEAILRSLPRWFGVEESLLAYARATTTLPTFAAEVDGTLTGFITLQQHFATAWEVHCFAVAASARGAGIGSRLLDHAERWLVRQGACWLQVKTLADAHPSPEYAQTRAFYRVRGFVPLEVFPTLWSAQHPALQMIKPLDRRVPPP